MTTACFESEVKTYESNRDTWLGQGLEGWFVIIKGSKVVGKTRTFEEAVECGIRETRTREFLIRQIQAKDRVEWLSHID